ncbi:MAG TPA: ABC transporter substrate-binding protein [Candidatus Limnocylindria bacterium]|nr:ABC transporter substrate-binding protein [Candidatus Limnocylindria bacterium]
MQLDRRAFLVGTAATLVPCAAGAQAQRGAPAHRIGWISTEAQPDPFVEGFREGLRRHGYVEGRNVILDLRYARDLDTLRTAAAELTQSKVAFIVSSGPAIRAIRGARDIPVLFAISGDLVEIGLAASLGRPGGNFTGLTFLSLEIAGKRVELLKQAVPRLRRLAVLSNTDHPGERSERRATEEAARALGLVVSYVPFTGAGQLDGGLSAVRDAGADAMVVFPEGATIGARARIAQFAIAERLPSMFGWSEYADAGGLMSYGANQRAAYVRLAAYADKLLRGARVAELPIEQPTQFELVINMRTAAALGITFPEATLLFANRRIE